MASKLTPDSFVLEFGSGWSSRWFAERCGRLLSIETSPEWADLVIADLQSVACSWHVALVADPQSVLEEELDINLTLVDLILIDCIEELRERCARLSWPLLRRGGWLIFDDAQRPVHRAAVEYMNSFGDPVFLTWNEGCDIPAAKERVALAWQK